MSERKSRSRSESDQPDAGVGDSREGDPSSWCLVVGLGGLLLWLVSGGVLEAFHGFKVVGYLQDEIRREMWTLAHAHGTLFSLACIVLAILGRASPTSRSGSATSRSGSASESGTSRSDSATPRSGSATSRSESGTATPRSGSPAPRPGSARTLTAAAARRADRLFASGSVLLPFGFLLGGASHSEGDPGLGILLVPAGGLLAAAGLVTIIVARLRRG